MFVRLCNKKLNEWSFRKCLQLRRRSCHMCSGGKLEPLLSRIPVHLHNSSPLRPSETLPQRLYLTHRSPVTLSLLLLPFVEWSSLLTRARLFTRSRDKVVRERGL